MTEREVLHVEYFLAWLNKEFGTHFEIGDKQEEYSDVDVVAKSGTIDQLLIQNVAYRGQGGFQNQHTKPKVFINGEPVDGPVPFTMAFGFAMTKEEKRDSIISCIKSKEKKYAPDRLKDLTLLIEATMPKLTPEELDDLNLPNLDTKFKAIYVVQLPITIGSDKYDKSGFVKPLKRFNLKDKTKLSSKWTVFRVLFFLGPVIQFLYSLRKSH